VLYSAFVRLADLVLAERVKVPDLVQFADSIHPGQAEKARLTNAASADFLRMRIPVIDASLVAEQVFGAPMMSLEDFPCLRLPWPMCWIEFARPRGVSQRIPERWGFAVIDMDIETFARNAQARNWPTDAEYGFIMTLYIQEHGQALGPCATWEVAVDERGIGITADYTILNADQAWEKENDQREHDFARMTFTALQAITFFHCRNVHVVPGEAPPPKVAAKQVKKLGRPLLAYSVVKIDPFRTRQARGEGLGGAASARRLHTVPGHYSHFGNCCPGVHEPHGKAFGTLTGMFWVPPHVRGDLEAGAVVHDYEVRPNGRVPARP
jgi:hypothetical protein